MSDMATRIDSILTEPVLAESTAPKKQMGLTNSLRNKFLAALAITVVGTAATGFYQRTPQGFSHVPTQTMQQLIAQAQARADYAPQNAAVAWITQNLRGEDVSGTIRLLQATRDDGIHEQRHFVMEVRSPGQPFLRTHYTRTQNDAGVYVDNEPQVQNAVEQISRR